MSEACPVCTQEMSDDRQIGPYCLNVSCPVSDDAKLWYQDRDGKWRVQRWMNTFGNRYQLSPKENVDV